MIPLGELAVFGLVGVMTLGWMVVVVWAYWKILERVGYDRRWSLLVLVPGVYQFFAFWVALAEWPKLPWTGGIIRFGGERAPAGAAIPGYCTVCGAAFRAGARYCPQCGGPLAG